MSEWQAVAEMFEQVCANLGAAPPPVPASRLLALEQETRRGVEASIRYRARHRGWPKLLPGERYFLFQRARFAGLVCAVAASQQQPWSGPTEPEELWEHFLIDWWQPAGLAWFRELHQS